MTPPPLEVAYLVSQYPAPSNIFIEREVEGLRSVGAQVHTFSVRPTPPDLLLSPLMKEEAARTKILQEDRREVARAVARLSARRPGVAARVLAEALRTGERRLKNRTWQVFYLAEAAVLYEEMRRRGLRHLHVHFGNNAADIARLVVALGRAEDGDDSAWRWSLTMHGPTEFEAVAHFDLAAKVRSATGVACISDFTRSQLMRLVEPEVWPSLQVIRMSVDMDRWTPPPVARDHSGPLRVLSVGRLVPEKGAPVLLEALATLRRAGVATEAKLVGAGELESLLAQRIVLAGLDDTVELTGLMGQDELPALFHWADVFCLPSFQEGLPVVLLEAMATELPVVTTSVAGIPELVTDGVNGRLLPAGRADLISQALTELAADPRLRERLGCAGRQRIREEFSQITTARRQLGFLQDVQGAPASSANRC